MMLSNKIKLVAISALIASCFNLTGCSISGQKNSDRAYTYLEMRNMTSIYERELVSNEKPITTSTKEMRHSQCVMQNLTRAVNGAFAGLRTEWNVALLRECTVNAALLNTGVMISSACTDGLVNSQDELAYIFAVAFAHSLLEHDNERATIALKEKNIKASDNVAFSKYLRSLNGYEEFSKILGINIKDKTPIPYTQKQVQAADTLALQMMSAAGFNPSAAFIVWQNFNTKQDPRTAQYVKLNPHTDADLEHIANTIESVKSIYATARAKYGRVPLCR